MTNAVTMYFKQACYPLFKHLCSCNLRISNCGNDIVTMEQQRWVNPTLSTGRVCLFSLLPNSTRPSASSSGSSKQMELRYLATQLRLPTLQNLRRISKYYALTKSRRYFDQFYWLCNMSRTSFFTHQDTAGQCTRQLSNSAISTLEMKVSRTPFDRKLGFLQVKVCTYQGHYCSGNKKSIVSESMYKSRTIFFRKQRVSYKRKYVYIKGTIFQTTNRLLLVKVCAYQGYYTSDNRESLISESMHISTALLFR
jgi:hypothetical protein